MDLNDWIIEELKKSNFNTSITSDLYSQVLAKFGIQPKVESFSRHVRRVKQRYLAENAQEIIDNDVVETTSPSDKEFSPKSFKNEDTRKVEKLEEGNTLSVSMTLPADEVKNLEQLLQDCEVDLNTWNINSHKVNRWETLTKQNGEYIKVPIYQVNAFFTKKIPDVQLMPVIAPVSVQSNHKPEPPLTPSTGIKKSLILADGQIGFERDPVSGKLTPFHDRKSMEVVLQIIKDNVFDEILFIGDFIDAPEASLYPQKPEFALTLQPALNECAWYLSEARRLAPNSKIVYMLGNHDVRLQKRMMENLKFAYNLKAVGQDFSLFSYNNLLNLPAYNIELIEDYPSGQHWISDELVVKHGEYTNLAKELQMSTVSVIMGHLHRPETISKTIHSRSGRKTITVSCAPALCQNTGIVPGVSSRPIWSTGFTYVETNRETQQSNIHHVLTDHEGSCMFNGKIYRGKEYNISLN